MTFLGKQQLKAHSGYAIYQQEPSYCKRDSLQPAHPQQITLNGISKCKRLRDFYPLLVLIALIGSLAVGLGAYGAHVLGPKKEVSPYRKQVYEIANKYQFYHSLALALVPMARKPQISSCLFLLGMFMFCGSNYYYALSDDLTYIMLTPTGGITLAVAWLSLLIPM